MAAPPARLGQVPPERARRRIRLGSPEAADQAHATALQCRNRASADRITCSAFFRTAPPSPRLRRGSAARWPHRAGDLTCLRRANHGFKHAGLAGGLAGGPPSHLARRLHAAFCEARYPKPRRARFKKVGCRATGPAWVPASNSAYVTAPTTYPADSTGASGRAAEALRSDAQKVLDPR